VNGIVVVWTGRPAPRAVDELAEEYAARIARLVPFREVRLRPETGRDGDRARVRRREAARVREYLEPVDTLIVLDERGRQLSSEELSRRLSTRLAAGRVVLVVGSDLGVDDSLREEAAEVWALSRLTLPHLLVRVVLLEQLYRGLDIAAGGRYHRS
jgi:23S rRNA (pseudouridine1915-N3)-methyltransferase